MSKYQQKIGFRSIRSLDEDDDDDDDESEGNGNTNGAKYCNHWSSALQVVCHVLVPLRKALIHYYLNHKNKKNPPIPDDKVEWKLLFELGCIFQTMITVVTQSPTKEGSGDNNEEEDEENEPPVDPTSLYLAIQAVMDKRKEYKNKTTQKTKTPKDATEALQILLELIQSCTRSLPVTSQLWSALLDESGLGAIAKQTIVGKKKYVESKGGKGGGNFLLQRTMKETRILLCPFPLLANAKYDSIVDGITQTMKHTLTKSELNWDDTKQNKPDFEAKIPLWDTNNSNQDDDDDKNEWNTVKTMQFDTLPNYWFISIQRFVDNNAADKNDENDDNDEDDDEKQQEEKELLNAVVDIPVTLDVAKYCTTTCKNRQFQLVGGVLFDDDHYVAILKNSNIVAKAKKSNDDTTIKTTTSSDDDDEGDDAEPIEDWNLMETDEVIPMTQEDAVEFLRGGDDGGGGGVCGTVLVYKTTNEKELKSSDQLLSDIIISHVSGKLDSKVDFYYEEEIIED